MRSVHPIGNKNLYVAVDFDGTCVKHAFPEVGDEIPHASEMLKWLVSKGFKLILFTMRSGEPLLKAIAWFVDRGIFLTAVNVNPEQDRWTSSSKVFADFYIDDQAVGSFVELDENGFFNIDWLKVKDYFLKFVCDEET